MQKTDRKMTAFLKQCGDRLLTAINKISERKMTIGALILFLLSILPVLILGRYSVMCIDDYNYGVPVHDAWVATGSFMQAVQAASEQVKTAYQIWQGTYASCFLMAMCPMNFYYEAAFIVPIITIGLFAVSVFLLGRQLLIHWLGCGKKWVSFVLLMLLFMYYQIMEAPFEGIYWYNGAIHYIFMESLLFFTLTLVSACIWSEKKGRPFGKAAAASVIAVIVGGGNLVTGLQAEILLLAMLLFTFLTRRKKTVYVLLPYLLFTAGFLCNILAPGNGMRASTQLEATYSPITAVILSFYYAVVFIIRWTNVFTIMMWIALLPVFRRIAARAAGSFRYPVWVTLGAFCVLAAMFTPTLYAMGTAGVSRVDNIIQMVYYLCLFMLTIYWFGWSSHKEAAERTKQEDRTEQAEQIEQGTSAGALFGGFLDKTGNVLTMAVLALVFIIWIMTGDKNTYTGISALRSLAKGEAQTYYAQAMERHELYVDASVREVILEPFSAKPALFAFEDLTEEEGYWLNLAVAAYYHKDSVRLREEASQ
ncbi:MAG: DUF6056 family protein [Roseburia sp.]|nr:DUF6056 family protein [Roseburia sp.]MCM1241606.1 DUF6056 family protein [Roseburia sp.]